jgi:hypothetical protein
MSPLARPRRIVTDNLSLPEVIALAAKAQPEVAVIQEEIIPVSLLGGNATKWPIYTYQTFPTNANEPYDFPAHCPTRADSFLVSREFIS